MGDIAGFYRQPSPTSDLGRHHDRVPGLPADPEALGAIVRGLLVHDYTASVQGLRLSAERMSHKETVGAASILDNVAGIDPAPLDHERPMAQRMLGFCYHFALLHCALLRATGTPARIRCGFAGYFDAQRWIDHWVVEYWDGSRWILTDPQTGRGDLTADDFQDGVTAWKLCRDGASTPSVYGNGELWGWDELRGSLINDVAALNKIEVAGWYWCDRLQVEPLDQPHDDLDTSLDDLARLAAAEELRTCADRYPEFLPPADAVAR
ncbi:transglutaminase-like domain-containing protein [Catenuloplanes japonicus]|uniref:transglutaminase-like domain-containing protein n=1 Tax=Catenuloplanes japonicus TaxID=33876 RepID=UPI0006900B50|nr:transglutaminase-like domain-containing protein [Catenuloplanes japonicus]